MKGFVYSIIFTVGFFVFPSLYSQPNNQITSDISLVINGLNEINKRGFKVDVNDTVLIQECNQVLNFRNDSIDEGVYRFIYFSELIDVKRRQGGLPWFVNFLPLANSCVDPNFKAKDGKSGIWPLGYTIGKKYGLIQNSLYDERRDVEKSTEVAVKYISELNNIYKDWNLTIMAFNLGAARVNQVMHFKKALNFDSIFPYFLDEEKKQYRNFIATIYAYQTWEKQGITLSESKWIAYNQLKITVSSSFELPLGMIESRTGISSKLIKKYNPALKADVIPYLFPKNSGSRPLFIRLPEAESKLFKQKQDSFEIWTAEWNFEKARENNGGVQPIGTINRHTGELISNPPNSVQNPPIQNTATTIGTDSIHSIPTVVSKTWVYYTIKKGDALYTLLDVFDCTESEVRQWNNIRKPQFLIAGQKLKFEVDLNKKGYYSRINQLTLVQKRELAKND